MPEASGPIAPADSFLESLMDTELADAGPGSRALILKWNGLHAVRTAFGALAVIAFLIALGG